MGILVWFLVTVGALGTLHELSTWETFLKSIDSTLPTMTAKDSKVCYYFDIAPTCAGDAIGTLLKVASVANVLTWAPSAADCSKLLDQQLPALEAAASSLFGPAIASAVTQE